MLLDDLSLEDCTRDGVAEALLAYRTAPDARFTSNPSAASTWKSDESIRGRTSALRTFFGWYVRTDRLLRDPTVTIDAPPTKPPLPKAFTESEARAIHIIRKWPYNLDADHRSTVAEQLARASFRLTWIPAAQGRHTLVLLPLTPSKPAVRPPARCCRAYTLRELQAALGHSSLGDDRRYVKVTKCGHRVRWGGWTARGRAGPSPT